MSKMQENIQALIDHGWSQQQIADAASNNYVTVTQQAISRFKSGRVPAAVETAESIERLVAITRRKWRKGRL